MNKVALIIGFASILSFPAFAEDQMLDGTYKLVSSTRKLLDTGDVVDTYGKHPTGYVNYGKDGRFLVLIVWDKNDRPNPESVKVITDQQRADLFRTMTSYGGTYTFDGHTLEHHVDIFWNQVWTGTTVIRDVQKDGDKLIYTTRPAPFAADGDGEQDRVYRSIIRMSDGYNSGDQEFDAFPKVVATINDPETGNDVICGRTAQGSPPPLQNRELTSVDGVLRGRRAPTIDWVKCL